MPDAPASRRVRLAAPHRTPAFAGSDPVLPKRAGRSLLLTRSHLARQTTFSERAVRAEGIAKTNRKALLGSPGSRVQSGTGVPSLAECLACRLAHRRATPRGPVPRSCHRRTAAREDSEVRDNRSR